MLKTKSILAPKEESDGKRFSVMSRHTLDDGITPHPEINEDSYDAWIRELAAPDKLIGAYLHRGMPFEEFKAGYIKHLRKPEIAEKVAALAAACLDNVITILCKDEFPEYCHRRLLAEECKIYQPELVLDIQ
jgi:uncharacterized protein YeaO (DUF488 family)